MKKIVKWLRLMVEKNGSRSGRINGATILALQSTQKKTLPILINHCG